VNIQLALYLSGKKTGQYLSRRADLKMSTAESMLRGKKNMGDITGKMHDTKATANYSSFAMKQMAKMGWKE
jgi:hypothetical protein